MACAQDGQCQYSLSLLENMVSSGLYLPARTCTVVLSIWSKKKDISLQTILALFEEMVRLGLRPNAVTHNTIINAILSKGNPQQALAYMRKAELSASFVPDKITYHLLLKECKNVSQAREILRLMEEREIKPGVVTYTSAIKACNDRADDALVLFHEMAAKGVVPNIVTYNTVLKCCVKGKQFAAALGIFETMVDTGPDPDEWSFVQAIKAANLSNQPKEALKILKIMKQRGIEMKRFHYTSYLQTLCKLRECNTSQIEQVFEEMAERNIEMDAHIYTTGFQACSQVAKGGGELALRLLEKMRSDRIRITEACYATLMKACIHNAQQVEEQYNDFIGAGFEPTINTVMPLIVSYCNTGQWEKVLSILREANTWAMTDTLTKKLRLYDGVLSALVTAGLHTKAQDFISNIYPEENLQPSIVSITIYMNSLIAQGQADKAIAIFEESMKNGMEPDGIALSAAMKSCRSQNNWHKAVEVFEEYWREGLEHEADIFNSLIITLDEQGQSELAAKYCRKAFSRGTFQGLISDKINYIDLHGLPIPVSKIAVRCLLQEVKESHGQSTPLNFDLQGGLFFIVGTSNKSERSIKTEVMKVIEGEFDLVVTKFQENSGLIGVIEKELNKLISNHG